MPQLGHSRFFGLFPEALEEDLTLLYDEHDARSAVIEFREGELRGLGSFQETSPHTCP
jgi:hypothetical protein